MKQVQFIKKLCLWMLAVSLLATVLCVPIGAESDGTLIAYQVTEGEDGVFSLRLIVGINSLDYRNFGYEITLTTKDAEGNDVTEVLTGESNKVYSSVYGGGAYHSVRDSFGYEYAALATVNGLAIDSEYTCLEVRTYTVAKDGDKVYGVGAELLYTGDQGENGYPVIAASALESTLDHTSMLTASAVGGCAASIDWSEFQT